MTTVILSQFANDAALCCRLMSVSMRGQMQYRASFLMLVAGTFAISFLEFGAVWIMFDRFGHLRDWSLAEVAVFYGLVNSGFALAEADLQLRGPGDLFGTTQSGIPSLRVASLLDAPLIDAARREAETLLDEDPDLKRLDHQALKAAIASRTASVVAEMH